MTTLSRQLISDVRTASRTMVRELGFMGTTIAGTDLPPSAVHAIVELGYAGSLPARDLATRLCLEKSTVSRLVANLIERGEIREQRAPDDARVKLLSLSTKGQRTRRTIENHANQQVSEALSRLGGKQQQAVKSGLENYALALRQSGERKDIASLSDEIEIRAGYAPGMAGGVLAMLVPHMFAHCGFGAAFEARVGSDLCEYLARLGQGGSQSWNAFDAGKIVGSITIDGQSLPGSTAQLRWFVVDPNMRGTGVGGKLLEQAVAHSDAHSFPKIKLWTIEGLDSARRLYENHGFELCEQFDGDQWGSMATEQVFVRSRPN